MANDTLETTGTAGSRTRQERGQLRQPSGSTETEGSGVSRFFCFDKLNHHKGIYSGLTPIFRERNVGVNPLGRVIQKQAPEGASKPQRNLSKKLCQLCILILFLQFVHFEIV